MEVENREMVFLGWVDSILRERSKKGIVGEKKTNHFRRWQVGKLAFEEYPE